MRYFISEEVTWGYASEAKIHMDSSWVLSA